MYEYMSDSKLTYKSTKPLTTVVEENLIHDTNISKPQELFSGKSPLMDV